MRTLLVVAAIFGLGACLESPNARVTGRAIDVHGTALPGLPVTLQNEPGFPERLATATTDAHGNFTIEYPRGVSGGDDPIQYNHTLTVRRDGAGGALTQVRDLGEWSIELGDLTLYDEPPVATLDDTHVVVDATTLTIAINETLTWDVVNGVAVLPIEALRTAGTHTVRALTRLGTKDPGIVKLGYSPAVEVTLATAAPSIQLDGFEPNHWSEGKLLTLHTPQAARLLIISGFRVLNGTASLAIDIMTGPDLAVSTCTPHDTTIVCTFAADRVTALGFMTQPRGMFWLTTVDLF